MNHNILRLPEVMKKTGLSRSAVYLGIQQDTFPEPIKLSLRAVGWIESEIDEWIDERVNARCFTD